MLKRLSSAGINWIVVLVSFVVAVGAFCAQTAVSQAQTPPTITILAAAFDLQPGHVFAASDLVEKTVYEDANAALYVPVAEAASLIGGAAVLPVYAGTPILRSAVIAPGGQGFRLAAILAEYPDHSLFPLPLDEANILAPDATAFLPGDLVGLTVVIGSRPQSPATATPAVLTYLPTPLTPPSLLATPQPAEPGTLDALGRAYPPLAKDLVPEGARVVMIQGLPVAAAPDPNADPNAPPADLGSAPVAHMLILLIPNALREELALALEQGDRLIVTLLGRGTHGPTAGYTYWDFEDWFFAEREAVVGPQTAAPTATPATPATPAAPGAPGAATPTPTPLPTATP